MARHWLTADIHGAFSRLWGELQSQGFNPVEDTLYSLGDLVNRGAESAAASQWLMKPWFKAIRGNHEAMILQRHANPSDTDARRMLENVGGVWWDTQSKQQKELLAGGFSSLPYVRTLKVLGRSVGLIHADVPEGIAWDDMGSLLEKNDQRACETALWSRARWQASIGSGLVGDDLPRVDGVDWVFVGHSPVDKPTIVGNVVFLDCGLWRGNTNGIICLEDWLLENDPELQGLDEAGKV